MSYKPLFIGTALFFILGAALIIFFFGCSAFNGGKNIRLETEALQRNGENPVTPEVKSTVVIFNSRSEYSLQAALSYMEEHNIRRINVCAVDVPLEDNISWRECESSIVRNIKDTLMMLGEETVTDLVFSYDIPAVIHPRPAHVYSSLDKQISHIGKDSFEEKANPAGTGEALTVARIEKNQALMFSYSFVH